MTKITYYFDLLCPWSWLTSLWAREVREHSDLEITWKFFSLAEVNQLDGNRYGSLRIAALARREGGNDAVDRAYLALGRLFHEKQVRPESLDDLAQQARTALEEVGLDPSLGERAFRDESTLEDVLVDHREAVDKLDAFGVPWIVLEGQDAGFFGPVVGERLRGADAVKLWEHFAWLSTQPYLFELKRGRASLPKLEGLSDEFVPTAEPVGSATR